MITLVGERTGMWSTLAGAIAYLQTRIAIILSNQYTAGMLLISYSTYEVRRCAISSGLLNTHHHAELW